MHNWLSYIITLEVGLFEVINADRLTVTLYVNTEIIGSSAYHSKRSWIGWLQWLAYHITMNKNVRTLNKVLLELEVWFVVIVL